MWLTALSFMRTSAGKAGAGIMIAFAILTAFIRADRKAQARKAETDDLNEALRIRRKADEARNTTYLDDADNGADADRLRDRITKNLGR